MVTGKYSVRTKYLCMTQIKYQLKGTVHIATIAINKLLFSFLPEDNKLTLEKSPCISFMFIKILNQKKNLAGLKF